MNSTSIVVKYTVPAPFGKTRNVSEVIANSANALRSKINAIKAVGGTFKSSEMATAN